METLEKPVSREAAVALSSGDADHLRAILQRDVALAIWWRQSPVALSTADLDGLCPVHVQAKVEELATAVQSALAESGFRWWHAQVIDDITDLSRRYADLMDVDRVEIRLEVISTNACWKFHSDYVRARMIATYYGPGTEWTIQEQDGLGRIHQLATGNVGVFKGRTWAPEALLLHRSPPIVDTGDIRLLLVIDAAPAN